MELVAKEGWTSVVGVRVAAVVTAKAAVAGMAESRRCRSDVGVVFGWAAMGGQEAKGEGRGAEGCAVTWELGLKGDVRVGRTQLKELWRARGNVLSERR